MEVAPVDAQVVAGAIEDVLIARAYGEDFEERGARAGGDDALAAIVDGDERIDVEQDGDVMTGAAGGVCRPSEIGNGAGVDVEIAGHGRSEECELDDDAGGREGVARVSGVDGVAGLLHGRNLFRIAAHEAVGLAVDTGDADEGLRRACPMRGVRACEGVGCGPDAEVGIVRDQRRGWDALLSGSGCGSGTSEHAKKQKRLQELHRNPSLHRV